LDARARAQSIKMEGAGVKKAQLEAEDRAAKAERRDQTVARKHSKQAAARKRRARRADKERATWIKEESQLIRRATPAESSADGKE
jgi:hypothetical protein